MNLTLQRTDHRVDGVFGVLKDGQGEPICFTLEHAYGDAPNEFMPKVPVGEYVCVRGTHRLSGQTMDFETFEITGVPNHTGILFHCGNTEQDSSGCVLLGSEVSTLYSGVKMLTRSRAAFEAFMGRMTGIDSFNLTVTG